jgi:hypothetical protein
MRRLFPRIETSGIGDSVDGWVSEDTIRVAEYFYKTTRKVCTSSRTARRRSRARRNTRCTKKHLGKPIKSRMSVSSSVKWMQDNGYEILEKATGRVSTSPSSRGR